MTQFMSDPPIRSMHLKCALCGAHAGTKPVGHGAWVAMPNCEHWSDDPDPLGNGKVVPRNPKLR